MCTNKQVNMYSYQIPSHFSFIKISPLLFFSHQNNPSRTLLKHYTTLYMDGHLSLLNSKFVHTFKCNNALIIVCCHHVCCLLDGNWLFLHYSKKKKKTCTIPQSKWDFIDFFFNLFYMV